MIEVLLTWLLMLAALAFASLSLGAALDRRWWRAAIFGSLATESGWFLGSGLLF